MNCFIKSIFFVFTDGQGWTDGRGRTDMYRDGRTVERMNVDGLTRTNVSNSNPTWLVNVRIY